MGEPLKNYLNEALIERIGLALKEQIPKLDLNQFKAEVLDHEWDGLELKQRMRHISQKMRTFMAKDYPTSLKELIDTMETLKEMGLSKYGFELMAFPDYIEVFGNDHYEESIYAIELITQTTSCEFAIRPFILKEPKKTISKMLEWSKHDHHMVRRLSSEGCRPRLPWAMALPILKKDPSPILPILERLKNDPSEIVRRSVANNLNDISKDNPEVIIKLARQWLGENEHVNKVIKHACRSLLKAGNSEVMELFGFGSIKDLEIVDFKILTPQVNLGGQLTFSFQLKNKSQKPCKIRLEYAIYFMKSNGKLSKKVFSISEKDYDSESTTAITRNQPFKVISTRKLYHGLHQIALVINGNELPKHDFQVIV